MTVEDRLREALRAEAQRVTGDDDAWSAIQTEVARRRVTKRNVRVGALALVAAAAVSLVAIAVTSPTRDAAVDLDAAGPSEQTTTTAPLLVEVTEFFPGIWPFASIEAAEAYRDEPGIGTFFDPEQTALEFARSYLGMPDPVSPSGAVPSAEGTLVTVAVSPRPGAPATTGIRLKRMEDRGPYVVKDAYTEDIRVSEPGGTPSLPALVGNPVTVTGESTAYEGTVQFEVRQHGQGFGQNIGRGFFTAGANGEMRPFAEDLAYELPTRDAGAIVFWIESPEDGSVERATVVPVRFRERAASDAGLTRFSVFFHEADDLVELRRTVPLTPLVLRYALDYLFRGPTEEERQYGIDSLFSAETTDLLRDVALGDDGTAVVDIDREVPNANTSAGSTVLLEEMNATVFQFSDVQRIEYRLRGSCEAFWEWLQHGRCKLVERD